LSIELLGVSKKTKKPIKPRKPNHEKKPIKILKNRPVQFYKPETEKTKPN
jgi:hypothetical protein